MSSLIIHKVALVIFLAIAAAVLLPPSGGDPT